MSYFPAKDDWHSAAPESSGFDTDKLNAAVQFAQAAETKWPRDLSQALSVDSTSGSEPAPYNEVLGPTLDRDGPNGVVIRAGKIVAHWGDTSRVEMTFSVAKSYLAILAGVAIGDGLIGSIDDPVREYCKDGDFDSRQNHDITWRHLLHQSSEWEGELWGKPDWLDHNRQVGTGKDNSLKGTRRELQAPGTFYEYNDIRVNRLSLSLLQVFKQPLADVLRERVMDPINASDSWQWHAYRNAWADIDGQSMPSVPGGSHWGGGIFINSLDHARVGWLVRSNGEWNAQRILPAGWVDFMRTPSPCFDHYGALWWLNTRREQYATAPESSFFAMGAGKHLIWIDQELDLVVVCRWMDANQGDAIIDGFMKALLR